MTKTEELNTARERMIQTMKEAGKSAAWINGALSAFDRNRSDKEAADKRKPS